MTYSKNFEIAKMISAISCPLLFDGKFSVSGEPYHAVDKVLFAEKVANIVIAGTDLRMIFKIHYTNDLGETLMGDLDDGKKVSTHLIDDYFLEMCNIAAGRIKLVFLEQNIVLGFSIPIKTKAFDDLFNLNSSGNFSSEWHWDIAWEKCTAHLSLFVELLNADLELKPYAGGDLQINELEFL